MNLKNIKRITGMLIVVISILFTSCDNNDDLNYNDVAGTYEGSLTVESNKSIANTKSSNNIATAVVSMVGDQIEVHCFGDNFDSTIMLDLYHNGNEINVCLTGIDFENTYGHMLGQGHISGGMTGHMQDNESEWMHHLNDEHQENDKHFGGFNMQDHTFNYTFETDNGNFHFQGTKK